MPRAIEDKKRRAILIVIGISSLIFFASILEPPAEKESKPYTDKNLMLGSVDGLQYDVVYVVKRYVWMGNKMGAVVSPEVSKEQEEVEEIWTLDPEVTALSLGSIFRLSREKSRGGEAVEVLHRGS